jgi:hypothetical protein
MNVDVAKLTDSQVTILLGMGQSTMSPSVVELLRTSFNETSGRDVQLLVADLRRKVLADDGGLLSFRRLMEISDEEAVEFEGKSYVDMLTASETSANALARLVQVGRLVSLDVFPASTRITGAIIASFAQLALVKRHGASAQIVRMEPTKAVLEELSNATALSDILRNQA